MPVPVEGRPTDGARTTTTRWRQEAKVSPFSHIPLNASALFSAGFCASLMQSSFYDHEEGHLQVSSDLVVSIGRSLDGVVGEKQITQPKQSAPLQSWAICLPLTTLKLGNLSFANNSSCAGASDPVDRRHTLCPGAGNRLLRERSTEHRRVFQQQYGMQRLGMSGSSSSRGSTEPARQQARNRQSSPPVSGACTAGPKDGQTLPRSVCRHGHWQLGFSSGINSGRSSHRCQTTWHRTYTTHTSSIAST